MSNELILKNKYIEALDKIEPSEQKKQEFLYKTLQRKKELQASSIVKAESKPNKRFNWKIRHFIIAACVAAVLIFSAFFIPLMTNMPTHSVERIVILDASASMMARQKNGKTRFENSVEKARKMGRETIAENKQVTVVLAGKKAETIISTKSLDELNSALDSVECTYGRADIDGARALADSILSKNRKAKTTLYTAQQYESNDLETVDAFENEWNAAILNVENALVDNYYTFEITVASYNKDADLMVHFEAEGVNDDYQTITVHKTVNCQNNEPFTFEFEGLKIYEYDSVRIYIDEDDSFDCDNEFNLYDGRKETIRMLYVSSFPAGHNLAGHPSHNAFFKSLLVALQGIQREKWKIEIYEGTIDEIELKGYDFYIIENEMPKILPTDGVILLINPDIAPQGLGVDLGVTINADGEHGNGVALTKGESSPILNNMNPEKIVVSKYTKVTSHEGFQTLMYCGNDPAVLVKDEADRKIMVIPFSLQYSNLPVLLDLPVLIFNYFFPPAITEYVFEVDEEVSVNARGQVLQVTGERGFTKTYTEFPNITVPPVPGSYTLTQTLMADRMINTDKFFVKIAAAQSDFSRVAVN